MDVACHNNEQAICPITPMLNFLIMHVSLDLNIVHIWNNVPT